MKKWKAVARNSHYTIRRKGNTQEEAETRVLKEAIRFTGIKNGWIIDSEEIEEKEETSGTSVITDCNYEE